MNMLQPVASSSWVKGLTLRMSLPSNLTYSLLFCKSLASSYAAVAVARSLDCLVGRLGSAGAKTMAVVMGEADVYVHDGGMYQWDTAAPAAVAAAAGLHVSRIDGSPLVYNRPDLWLPDFLVCRREIADATLSALTGG